MLHGISPERASGDWRENARARARPAAEGERLDLVTVRHSELDAFRDRAGVSERGLPRLVREALTTTVEDAEKLVQTSLERNRILAVNYGYTG